MHLVAQAPFGCFHGLGHDPLDVRKEHFPVELRQYWNEILGHGRDTTPAPAVAGSQFPPTLQRAASRPSRALLMQRGKDVGWPVSRATQAAGVSVRRPSSSASASPGTAHQGLLSIARPAQGKRRITLQRTGKRLWVLSGPGHLLASRECASGLLWFPVTLAE